MEGSKIQDAVNMYLESHMETFKSNLSRHSGYAIDHSEFKQIIGKVSVEFRKDPHYSDTVVTNLDINLDDGGALRKFKFTGIGNITIRVDLNMHINNLDNIPYIFGEVIVGNLVHYFKFFGIKMWHAFFNCDVQFLFMDEPIDEVDIYDYEDYDWESVDNGTNHYWEELTSLQESLTTKIIGRDVTINPDGTLTVSNHKGEDVKIRMYVSMLGDINVAKLKMSPEGLYVTGKAGRTELIKIETVKDVIHFVDHGNPDELDSGNPFRPNIKLKKV